ncbi:hypothetical protein CO180_01730 [candidate division WWE3 bacterium CG_4_9_14_3_um_filter_41_6]|uniref:Uncharacterized protein n=1 Tax=candidate division WWE3 bacterium CG_4_10_14_0_2_um_filter_41_14 TaxID=1975072 RepID=A0A2M7TLA2_UNCKA|nr:MAG: hypothetical protein COY32_01905 [candidate division WWE3 bacterium CG_4_10_14_0_2_um_filter_41_14]PJA39024.1 MAG: hypothetical protein CO180_01730 [candidate division WWE3 bacterium CG_4_9_14_3_um_filter_41_6]
MDSTFSIDDVPKLLGFVETEELIALRLLWIEVMAARVDGDSRALATQYHTACQVLVESLEGSEVRKTAGMGLNLQMALARRDGGRMEDYREDLIDAQVDAAQSGFDDVEVIIRDEIRRLNEILKK